MKNKHLLTVVLGIMLVAALVSGCAAPAAAPGCPGRKRSHGYGSSCARRCYCRGCCCRYD